MASLPIAGFRGGSIATQGFSGLIGAPEPPVAASGNGSSMEVNGIKVTNLRAGQSYVFVGPFQTTDRDRMQIKVHAKANVLIHLNYEFSTDKGATWYVGQQRASHVDTPDDATGYNNQAHAQFDLGYWWRVSVYNAGGSAGNVAFSWRLHSF